MQYMRSIWAVLICLAVMATAGAAGADKKVVVISGVSEDNAQAAGTYSLVYEGIREGLKTGGIEPEFQFVELGALATDDLKQEAGAAAIAKVKTSRPDLIITLNDDCLKWVGSRIDDVPVVFAFVWGKPEALGLPKPNVTGVIRRSYAADVWAMAHKLIGAETVALISKKTTSMAGVRQYLIAGADKLEAASGVRFKEMFLCDTFAEWENCVRHFPADFIYLGDTSRISKDGREMSDAALVRWTVENASVPVIGADAKTCRAGALFSIVTSEKGIGFSAAETALKILDGAAPSSIPYVTSSQGKLVVNAQTAQLYNLDIPYDILSSAAEIYE